MWHLIWLWKMNWKWESGDEKKNTNFKWNSTLKELGKIYGKDEYLKDPSCRFKGDLETRNRWEWWKEQCRRKYENENWIREIKNQANSRRTWWKTLVIDWMLRDWIDWGTWQIKTTSFILSCMGTKDRFSVLTVTLGKLLDLALTQPPCHMIIMVVDS
jgi:hypothetical protein